MKVKLLHEFFDFAPFKGFLLGNKAIVYVAKPYGKIEKHAYKINESRELEVYEESSKQENPSIKGNYVYDENNRVLLQWREGDDFAYPLSATESDSRELIAAKERARRMFQRGYALGAYDTASPHKKGLFDDPVLLAMGVVVIVTAASMLLNYFAFDAMGVGILSDPEGALGVVCSNIPPVG